VTSPASSIAPGFVCFALRDRIECILALKLALCLRAGLLQVSAQQLKK
jgi:hypothetical protein